MRGDPAMTTYAKSLGDRLGAVRSRRKVGIDYLAGRPFEDVHSRVGDSLGDHGGLVIRGANVGRVDGCPVVAGLNLDQWLVVLCESTKGVVAEHAHV